MQRSSVTPRAVPSSRAPLEDLDAIAELYAAAREHSSADDKARLREQMIRSALPFAGRLARRYHSRGELPEDLEQVARLGLVKAVDRYDPDRGSFTAYAILTIMGELKRHFRDHTWGVHVPRRVQDLSLSVSRTTAALQQDQHGLTDAELAVHCDVTEDEIAEARLSAAAYRSTSLNAPIGDGSAELGDLIGQPDAPVDLVDDRLTAAHLIARLPARERQLLGMRFYGNRTQAEIAAELGLSQMHVSRLLSRALSWLRAAMLSDAVPRWQADNDPDRLEITTGMVADGAIEVRVAGEVDRDNAHVLSDLLLGTVRRAAAGQPVVIDLARMPLLDAAGVAVLASVHEAARVRGVPVTATGLQPHVRHIAMVSGLRAMLTSSSR
jgi:RNA polymerase sigma-B factor